MRKNFTMLFAALLACAGVTKAEVNAELQDKKISEIGAAVTAVTPGSWYILNNVGRGNYVSEETTAMKMRATSDVAVGDNAEGKAGYLFKITASETDGQYHIQSGNGLYFSLGWNSSAISETAVEYTISLIGESTDNFCLFDVTNSYAADGQETGNSFVGWSTSIPTSAGGNDSYRLLPVSVEAASFVDVTYNFMYEGEVKFSQPTKVEVGAAYPDYTVTLPYAVTAEDKPTGTVSESVTKEIALTVGELPFVAATDVYSINTWYYVQMHSNNKKYIQYIDDASAIEWADASVDASNKDSYTWAFVGNVFDGFKLVNKAATIEKALKSENSGNPKMASYADGTQFVLVATTETSEGATGGFCLKYPKGNCLNAQGSAISHWGATDAGSTFTIVVRDDAAQLRELVASANKILTALGEGTTVGCVTADSKTAISNAITAAQNVIDNGGDIDNVQTALQNALDGAQTIQPETDKFYTIASACIGADGNDSRANQTIYVNKNGGMQFSADDNNGKVFQFVDAGEGKFYLKNVENGTYLSTAKVHNGGQQEAKALSTEDAKAVTIANMGRSNVVSIVPEGGAMMHAQQIGSSIVGWNNSENTKASAWTIVEAGEFAHTDLTHTLTVSEAGWATLVLGYNTTIPTNVKVYTAATIEEGYVTLAEVKDVLPAHTPVLINAVADNYTFAYTASAGSVDENLLAGSVFNENVTGTGYVLANGTNGVGLYKATYNVSTDTSNDTDADGNAAVTYEAFLNNAGKAYLPVAEGQAAPAMFSFGRGEGTTSIDNAQLTNDNEVVIYDLAGRRVQKMEKGIYIVNGKKVIR